MTAVLAIDPGTTKSAVVHLESVGWQILHAEIYDNRDLLEVIGLVRPALLPGWPETLAIEMIESQGMAVGAETFQTVKWVGRFWDRWTQKRGPAFEVYRREEKLHLCGSARAKDGNIRQALIDRWGGDSVALRRAKACKRRNLKSHVIGCAECGNTGFIGTNGPLSSIHDDLWAALAVGVTYLEVKV
jgi:hypothetical protein